MTSIEPTGMAGWSVDERKSGLVSVDGRSIFLSVRGPPRHPDQPVAICISGMGATSYYWAAVQDQAGEFVRTFAYDRTGLGQSEPGPSPRTAAVSAQDLSHLLEVAKVPGPYIIVCHSYGGVIAREFLAIRSDDIAGIIFVDTITERYLEEGSLPEQDFEAVLGDLDFAVVSGLEQTHKLDAENWKQWKNQWPNDGPTTVDEVSVAPTSFRELSEKKQFERQAMGDRPVVVIKGNTMREIATVVEAGVAAGNGTEEQHALLRQVVETGEPVREKHQKEQLQLSTNSRYMHALNSGHNVQLTEPEVIVSEIKLILQGLDMAKAT